MNLFSGSFFAPKFGRENIGLQSLGNSFKVITDDCKKNKMYHYLLKKGILFIKLILPCP